MLKGIPHEDAALAAQAGIDAIIVSNHGGRFGDLVLLKEISRAHRCFEALVSGDTGL
jgi:isopentenyl diphosphate isomerase/L-lactate dehydrogenase-like FMN-dependent dehydrogenase